MNTVQNRKKLYNVKHGLSHLAKNKKKQIIYIKDRVRKTRKFVPDYLFRLFVNSWGKNP